MNVPRRGAPPRTAWRTAAGFALVVVAVVATAAGYSLHLPLAGVIALDAVSALMCFGGGVLVADSLSERRAERFRKRAIILQIGTQDHAAALEALRIAGIEGWHKDGSLAGKNLEKAHLADVRLNRANLRETNLASADLQRAELREADLQGAALAGANLKGAMLRDANLQGADLREAQLQGAWLFDANLQGADLTNADLSGAILELALFQGANLTGANLLYANLYSTEFDAASTMPDGRTWTPGTTMIKFTGAPIDTQRPSMEDDDEDKPKRKSPSERQPTKRLK